jgi:hypothetical protein
VVESTTTRRQMMNILVRALVTALALSASALASAGTLIALQSPVVVNLAYPYSHTWEGAGFAADDTITGYASASRMYPCSGRGCVPVRYTYVYASTWDLAGNDLSATYCGQLRTHPPQQPQWTYEPGYDATNCQLINLVTGTTVNVNGVDFYYVATSSDGLYELLNGKTGNYGSNVYQF